MALSLALSRLDIGARSLSGSRRGSAHHGGRAPASGSPSSGSGHSSQPPTWSYCARGLTWLALVPAGLNRKWCLINGVRVEERASRLAVRWFWFVLLHSRLLPLFVPKSCLVGQKLSQLSRRKDDNDDHDDDPCKGARAELEQLGGGARDCAIRK